MEKNYAEIFESLVEQTAEYLVKNNLKAQILGISGGIDSTVVAAICHEVAKRTNIPLIGRSLPTKHNKTEETITADLVGKAFCTDYKVCPIDRFYHQFMIDVVHKETGSVKYRQNELTGGFTIDLEDCLKFQTPIANGNIQARLRMMYLYNLASIHKGLVMDTDNLTENNLGYFTIHGDVGDFNPIGGLWKTEVFELAKWIMNWYGSYTHTYFYTDAPEVIKYKQGNLDKAKAIKESLKLQPTAGLGITSNDLEELGAESYEQVDYILQEILAWKWLSAQREDVFESIWDMRNAFLEEQQMLDTPIEVIIAVTDRHFKSEFKRSQLPIKIIRDEIL